MPSVFLSHSSLDKPLARRISTDLRNAGIRVWLDEWEILVGDSISQQVQRGLEDSEYVAVLLSPHSVTSGWVEKEWQSQIGLEATSRSVLILPLLAAQCAIPVLLRDKRYADFSSDYGIGLGQLNSAITGHAQRRSAPATGNTSAPSAHLTPSIPTTQVTTPLLPELSCRELLQQLDHFPLESQKLAHISTSLQRLAVPITFADFDGILHTLTLDSCKLKAIDLLRSSIQPLGNDEINTLLHHFSLPSTKSEALQALS